MNKHRECLTKQRKDPRGRVNSAARIFTYMGYCSQSGFSLLSSICFLKASASASVAGHTQFSHIVGTAQLSQLVGRESSRSRKRKSCLSPSATQYFGFEIGKSLLIAVSRLSLPPIRLYYCTRQCSLSITSKMQRMRSACVLNFSCSASEIGRKEMSPHRRYYGISSNSSFSGNTGTFRSANHRPITLPVIFVDRSKQMQVWCPLT